jgi:hypothetical protein
MAVASADFTELLLLNRISHLETEMQEKNKSEDNPESPYTTSEITNRWLSMMNQCLTLERLMTNRNRYNKRALKSGVALSTWSNGLLDEENLPRNWIWQSGVLVGIRPLRPLGRNT